MSDEVVDATQGGDSPQMSEPTEDTNKEAAQVSDQTEETPAPEPSESDKLKSGYEKRIARQTAALSAANRKIEELMKAMPKPEGPQAPKESDFENVEDYYKAVGKFEADQENAKMQAEAKEREATEKRQKFIADKQKAFEQKEVEFRNSNPDYDEAAALVNEAITYANKNSPEFRAFADAMIESDDMAALTYHLGKNPDVIEKLFTLSPTGIVRELAKIEANLSNPKSEPEPLPAPPVGVKGSGRGSKPLHELSAKELVRWARK